MLKTDARVDDLDPDTKAFLDQILLAQKGADFADMSDQEYLADSYALLESGAIVVIVDGETLSVEINPDFETAVAAISDEEG